MYFIQNRWKLEKNKLRYYGLRSIPNLFKNEITVSKKQAAILSTLPRQLNEKDFAVIRPFIGKQVVAEEKLKFIPQKLSEATFCKRASVIG